MHASFCFPFSRALAKTCMLISSAKVNDNMQTALRRYKVFNVLQAYKDMEEQNLIIKTHIRGARCLKFEALAAHALTIKLKENAKKMLRGEFAALAGGLVDESDVQPALLQAAKELLD